MIDRRKMKIEDHDIEERFENLTDTEIVHNFLDVLKKIYPNLIRVGAYCYDGWDSIAEPLYHTLVFETFSWKYGISLAKGTCHKYETRVSGKSHYNHLECIPEKYPVVFHSVFEERHEFSQEYLSDKRIVFCCFGDGINTLTGSIDIEDAKKLEFTKAEVTILETNGEPITDKTYYIDVNNISFEFVAV